MRHTGEHIWGDARARREIRTLRVNILGGLVTIRHVVADRATPPLWLSVTHPSDPDVVADYLAEVTTHVSGDVLQVGLADHAGSDHFDAIRLEVRITVDWNPVLVLDVRSGTVTVETAAAADDHDPDVTARVVTGRVDLDRVRALTAESFTGEIRAHTVTGAASLLAEHGQIRIGDAQADCVARTGQLGRIEFTGTPPPLLDVAPGEGTVTCHTAQVGAAELPAGHWAFTNDTLRWLGRMEDADASSGMPHPRLAGVRSRGLV